MLHRQATRAGAAWRRSFCNAPEKMAAASGGKDKKRTITNLMEWPVSATNMGRNTCPAAHQMVIERGISGKDSFARVIDGGTEGQSFTAIPFVDNIAFVVDTRPAELPIPPQEFELADKSIVELESTAVVQFVDGPGAAADDTQRAAYKAAYGREGSPVISADGAATYNPYIGLIFKAADSMRVNFKGVDTAALTAEGHQDLLVRFAEDARVEMAAAGEQWGLELRSYQIHGMTLSQPQDIGAALSLDDRLGAYLASRAKNPALSKADTQRKLSAESKAEQERLDALAKATAAVIAAARPMLGNGPGVLGSPLIAQELPSSSAAKTEETIAAETTAALDEPATVTDKPVAGAPTSDVNGAPPTDSDMAAASSLLEHSVKLESILSDFEDDELPDLVTVDDVTMTLEMLSIPLDAQLEGLVKRHTTKVDGDDEAYVAYKALLAEVKQAALSK